MESGLGGAFRILASSFEAVRIAIGEALEKPIQRLTENVSLAASSITNWIGENKRVVQVAAMVAAGVIAAGAALLTIGSAAAAASMAVGGLLGIFSAIGSVVGMAGAAVAALLSPIGLVVAGVAGLGLYLAKTSGLLSRVSVFFKTAFAQIAVDSQAAFKAIAASLASGDITGAAKVMWAYLRGLWKQGVAALADAWDQLSSSLDGFAGGLLSAVGSFLQVDSEFINAKHALVSVALNETKLDPVSFNTTGATTHINQSLLTRGIYAAPGKVAPDYRGAIGVSYSGVSGVDVTVPAFEFSVRKKFEFVSTSYLLAVVSMTGRTNSAAWSIFGPGEALFLGGEGGEDDNNWVDITYHFAARPNQPALQLGNIGSVSKRGWDYLWVKHDEEVVGDRVLQTSAAAYVEQVYPDGNFAALGLS